MIKEIKMQRMKNDIIRYLSNLIITINDYNTLYYYNSIGDPWTISKSYLQQKIRFNHFILNRTLPSDIDYDIFVEMVDQHINIENYEIILTH